MNRDEHWGTSEKSERRGRTSKKRLRKVTSESEGKPGEYDALEVH